MRFSISVILPVYNEERNLAAVVRDAMSTLPGMFNDYEIIIVDDGSTDKSSTVCSTLSLEFSNIQVIRHSVNQGYGAALRSGFSRANKDLVFFTDSDGQFQFEQIKGFLELIDKNDMVLGYRVNRKDPCFRKFNSSIGNFLARNLLGFHVKDINCAFKLFKRSLLQGLPLKSDGAFINTELLAYANLAAWSYQQLPVIHHPRLHGVPTGANLKVIAKTFYEYFALQKRIASYKHSTLQNQSARFIDEPKDKSS